MYRYLFVTGRLAAQSLGDCIADIPGLDYDIAVLPISVAALMNASFIAKHLEGARGCNRIVIPGLCEGELGPIKDKAGIEVVRGPQSLKDLPLFLGEAEKPDTFGEYKLRILAEIVDAYRMPPEKILSRAEYYRSCGADIIDLGCPVDGSYPGIDTVIRSLKKAGFAVSVDSFNSEDILSADRAGVDLVLSVNSKNIQVARQLHCKVVVIPDDGMGLESLDRNIALLDAWHVPYIMDPVLNPIGFGIAASIEQYAQVRRKYPSSEILMGIGNVTELTDADTTGVNAVMAGIATELEINYVLTTEVASWARGAVCELDCARRLMYYARKHRILPKHLHDGLLTIKDRSLESFGEDELRSMQAKIKDHHFRIFADREFIYVFNNRKFVKGTAIDSIFAELGEVDTAHAYYLGKELQKAATALKLGKRYVQEEDLRWGYLS